MGCFFHQAEAPQFILLRFYYVIISNRLPVTHGEASQDRMHTTCRAPSQTSATSVLESPGCSGYLWLCSPMVRSIEPQPRISMMYVLELHVMHLKTLPCAACCWHAVVCLFRSVVVVDRDPPQRSVHQLSCQKPGVTLFTPTRMYQHHVITSTCLNSPCKVTHDLFSYWSFLFCLSLF